MKLKFNISILLLSMLSVNACAPVLLTGAAASTYTIAKDQTLNQTANDIRIANTIKAGFIKNNFKNLYSKIIIEVSNSRVLLIGKVPSDKEIMMALRLAWQPKGVKEVINNLEIEEDSPFLNIKQYAKDTLITTQIKSKLLAHKDIKFVNYNIITSNGIVYIFGQARSEDELHKVANIASVVQNVRKVIDHVIILDN